MSAFSDRPLVADSIVGLRAFRVDALGRLTGVMHREVFRPGVNEATCLKQDFGYSAALQRLHDQMSAMTVRWMPTSPTLPAALASGGVVTPHQSAVSSMQQVKDETPAKAHQTAAVDCVCGFYAYTDGECDYGDAYPGETVRAIIRGTGVCTVGTRGFRASKAEIVALVLPTVVAKKSPNVWDRYSMWADRNDELAVPASMVGGLGSLFGMIAASLTVPLLFPLAVLLGLASAATFRAAWRGTDLNLVRERARRERRVDSAVLARVQHNYPDVPTYTSVKDAVAAHPLSTPATPTPETDEDFWTREATR